MNKKFAFGIEILWLALAVFSLAVVIYEANKKDASGDTYIWFIMTFVSFLMFTFRRYSRKYMNKNKQ